MYPTMKIAAVSLNPTVGNITENADKILNFIDRAISESADLIVFPEMSLIGYPPKDLIFLEYLYEQQNKLLKKIQNRSKKIAIVVGGFLKNKKTGSPFHNTAFVFHNGQKETYSKHLLPNYDVFDERRYFEPGNETCIFKIGKYKFALTICEDIWTLDPKLKKRYHQDPLKELKKKKFDLLLNISASPFELTKPGRRKKLIQKVGKELDSSVLYINQSGANDDLIFDGSCLLYNKNKQGTHNLLPYFKEDICFLEINKKQFDYQIAKTKTDVMDHLQMALETGIKDYVHKTGNQKILLGLSGGIDSALVAQLAANALGPENVLGVLMPSKYSSTGSVEDSLKLAKNLNIETKTIKIHDLHKCFTTNLDKVFGKNKTLDLTEQNLQARIRGDLLMALSNNTGRLLLNTTNKSELAMGYGTLYGDMCGALAVLCDLTKDVVYKLVKHMNPRFEYIPKEIFEKEPSAELKPDQTDSQSLPPYPVLDPLVDRFVTEENFDSKQLNYEKTMMQILRNEYKRKQTPVGLKVTDKAFTSGRRYPVVANLK